MANMNCQGCRQRFLPLPDLSRKIEGDSVRRVITIVLNILPKITMLTSFIATTSKRLDYVCPAANRTWQRLTIISCDLTHECDTYFLNISHIIYLNYYLPRINRLQSKPLRLIKTNRVNSATCNRHKMWLYA